MASRIITKKGSGAPLASDLVHGELAVDTVNKRLYTENAGGTIIELGTAPSTIDINAGTIDGTVIGGSSAAAITGTTITGTSFVSSGDMTFGDNDKAVFGAGSDLQIYHSGTQSYVQEVGTGNLILSGNGTNVQLFDGANNQSMVRAITGAEVELYHNGSEKLATTSTGVDVTGTVTADGLSVDGDVEVSSVNAILRLMETDTTDVNTTLRTSSGAFRIQSTNDAKSVNTQRLTIDHATGDLSLYENTGTTAKFFWDASAEALGIGTTSPSGRLTLQGAAGTSGKDQGMSLRFSTGTEFGALGLNNATGWPQLMARANAGLTFHVNSDLLTTGEAMRIDSSGNLLVGTTTTARTTNGFRYIPSTNVARFTSTSNQSIEINRTDASGGAAVIFYTADTGVGSISVTASATAYNTSSDERLKENIVDAPAGNIDAIKVRSFDWKADGSHQDYGMVAQELEAVAPYAVTKGETEDDMWSVDYSKLVPMLIKEIQDLKAEVAALKGA